jgi:hypothetical protein
MRNVNWKGLNVALAQMNDAADSISVASNDDELYGALEWAEDLAEKAGMEDLADAAQKAHLLAQRTQNAKWRVVMMLHMRAKEVSE